MTAQQTEQMVEIPIQGMDCADCARHVQKALAALPGVTSADVLLASEKAILRLDPNQVSRETIVRTVADTGYSVPETIAGTTTTEVGLQSFSRTIMTLFGIVFGAVLLIVVVGERLGLFEELTEWVPFPVGAALVAIAGYSVFRNVIQAARRRQIISHTLMTLGVIAALAVGQWVTAAIVVFFMRIGDFAERFTTERGRRAVRDLAAMAPRTARIERDGIEVEVPVGEVRIGDTVIVRPGEQIPVDGEILSGQATINQAAITGESMPVDVGPGSRVFAATLASLGGLRIRASHVGGDTTFGRVIKMVEEAETHRANVQRLADRFSTYFLPIVATIAVLTFALSRDPIATAAVLVVACSCSLALATPMAMLASIGAGAKRGLLIKGGKYLEALATADVVLLDKTGTLTLGQPRITDVIPLNGLDGHDVLSLAATTERYSEHPLAEAVRLYAREQGIASGEPEEFEALPGHGVRARVDGATIRIGNERLIPFAASLPIARELAAQGKTMLIVERDGDLAAILAAADTVRPEIPTALNELRQLGINRIELLTGDNERSAAALAEPLGIKYRANLLPEDKIAVVKDYQSRGHRVVMVGDGVNDAPALAQADIGIAMGAAGTDVAIEAAHIALMREDWMLVPEVFRIAKRTMRVVKMNIGFTGVYNIVGLGLAAFGIIPPIVAAAAQSLPDVGILANSSRLLRGQTSPITEGRRPLDGGLTSQDRVDIGYEAIRPQGDTVVSTGD